MISNRFFGLAVMALIVVLGLGMFTTLMENDSAQFAVMAMRMVQEQDWLHLWKGTEEYLDKPHFHYWLAALSYSVFGVYDWAYRIPAILALLLGAYSCYGLGRTLYSVAVGKIAALIFLSAQTIVLAGIDVRTDAVLTGLTALALWKLAAYLKSGNLADLLLGALASGLAFSTKGQIALVVIGVPILIHAIRQSQKNWFSVPKLLLALFVFTLAIAPMLYAYYLQFDLHPEKIIRGRDHRSGIFFIFWEQSFERLSGSGIGKNSSDYFFFFHTFLWVFLPWTLLGLAAYGAKMKGLWNSIRVKKLSDTEWMTAGGITVLFLLMSFAQFKLPHYLNILIPLFAVLTAAFLAQKQEEGSAVWFRRATGVQWSVLGVFVLVIAFIIFWVFPLPLIFGIGGLLAAISIGLWIWTQSTTQLTRLLAIGLYSGIVLNGVLNAYFYPKLLEYQSGSTLARQIKSENPEMNTLYKLDREHTWALDFYFGKPAVHRELHEVEGQEAAWYYVNEKQRDSLRIQGILWDSERVANQFRISRLQGRFLNPKTREQVVRKRYLLHVIPAESIRKE